MSRYASSAEAAARARKPRPSATSRHASRSDRSSSTTRKFRKFAPSAEGTGFNTASAHDIGLPAFLTACLDQAGVVARAKRFFLDYAGKCNFDTCALSYFALH